MKPTEALEKLNKAQEELDKLEKELPTAQEQSDWRRCTDIQIRLGFLRGQLSILRRLT